MIAKFMQELAKELSTRTGFYEICGVVDRESRVYPLGSDTKVLSTIFELIARPVIFDLGTRHGMTVVEPRAQNHYPDFTLMKSPNDDKKIAVDVKTTYRKPNGNFNYTLGGYTSFIRAGNEGAVSNLKCNTRPLDFIVEHFLGSSESEACAWPRVEAGGDFFEIAV